MTPFGQKVRALRAVRGITLKKMAMDLEISSAYLSALEHGHRGLPSAALFVQICEYFGLIWDDFEAMQRLVEVSDPRVIVDTRGLDARHTELANELAKRIGTMSKTDVEALIAILRPSSSATTGATTGASTVSSTDASIAVPDEERTKIQKAGKKGA
jgi:transcriptional regulator with XRE-family HTH domain